jgi:multidrug efflux pump subunit AcrA (membrane-fusion protein)
MKRQTLFFLAFLLTACGAVEGTPQITPTATPNPGDIAMQMIQQQANALATSQVVELQLQATQQVIGATATQQQLQVYGAQTEQARADAQATSEQARRDAQATQQRIDIEATQEQAQRVMVAQATQARLDLEATQRAEATSTAWAVTAEVLPTHNMWTQQAVEQDIIKATNEVELSNLAVQQARDTNQIKWQIPLLAALVVLVVGTIVILRESRWKIIKDDNGEVVGVGHAMTYITPKLLPAPVMDLETRTIHEVTDRTTQNEVTRRAQIIDALKVMPVNPSQGGAGAFNMGFGEKSEPPFEIVDVVPEALMDGEAMKAAEADWRKANE